MPIIVPLTVAGNLILCCLLLFNGYSSRHAALLGCCIYSVLADPILQQVLAKYPTAYPYVLLGSEAIVILFMLFIIAEAWWVREYRVRVLVEIQLIGEVVHLLLKARGFRWAAYFTNCSLLVFSLVQLCFFIWIFRKPCDNRMN